MGTQHRRIAGCLLLTVGLAAAAGVGAGPAAAQTRDPSVVSVFDTTVPALPPQVLLQVRTTDSEQLVAANPTTTPLVVLAPDGAEFLRISAAGVETNDAEPFTYDSRHGPDTAAALPAGVRPGAPARWARVSSDVSWRWYDPRLRPTGLSAPAGGRAGVHQELSRWTVPMRFGGTPVAANGAVERLAATGWFRRVADPAPTGLSAVVADGTPPSVVLAVPAGTPVTVLGSDGAEFLRRTAAGGWEANTASRTYLSSLAGSDRPVPSGTGWVPWSGAGSVSWADDRLLDPVDIDPAALTASGFTDVAHWQVPVRVGDRTVELTGATRYTPRPGADFAATGGSGKIVGLGLGVLLLAVGLGGLVLWNRRGAAMEVG